MKKLSLILLLACTTVFFSACTKYEEGGYASKNKIAGTWNLSEINANGVAIDLGNFGYGLDNIVFEKDGNGTMNYSTKLLGSEVKKTDSFTWSFSDDKESITIKSASPFIGMFPTTSEILKLTRKEFKIVGNISEINAKATVTLTKE